MLRKNHVLIALFALALVASSFGVVTLIAKDSSSEEKDRAMKAADVLTEVMGIPEGGIPDELMEHAEAIAVVPHMVKGAFGLGGQYGKGLVTQRLSNGHWSAPSFITIGGGSFGLQLGVQATDVILVFTNRDGFKGLLDGKLKLGADASVAAGPVGRKAQVASDVLLKSPVFAYSRSKGLFAGISLDGSVVTIADDANRAAYGRAVSAQDLLVTGKVRPNEVVAPFLRAVERYSPARKRVTD